MSSGHLKQAVLETLAYSDIFDYPLKLDELHRYLPIHAGLDEVAAVVDSLHDLVEGQDGYYFLAAREEIVETRRHREERSRKLLPIALRYGRVLGSLPFVRMVALTGSLAVMNVSKNADFDYMLVTSKGRVWTARAFALVLNRMARLFGHTLCPNLIVSETALEWPLHDLYSAHELYQMIPVTGTDVYQRLMKANQWAVDFLPNANLSLRGATNGSDQAISNTMLRSLFEFILRGKLGDRLEQWEMTRKIARFSKQPGFGEETVFNAEVCQGNFHHHRKWTREAFEAKLSVITRRAKLDEASSSRILEIASLPSVGRNDGIRL